MKGGSTPTEYKYTGQLEQAEIGLYYYVARWYDSELAHFVQADTIVSNSKDAAAYDRYTYVHGNPIRFSDPNGHYIFEDEPINSRKNSYFLGPQDAYRIFGVKTPQRVSMASVISSSGQKLTTTPNMCMPKWVGDVKNSATNILKQGDKIAESANWSLQTPESITLAESSGYPIIGGYRIYADFEYTNDNNNSITLGPSSTSIGPTEFGPGKLSYQTHESTINTINSTFNIGIPDMISPWALDFSSEVTYKNNNSEFTGILGFEYLARPDNMALVIAPAVIYLPTRYLPLLPFATSRLWQPNPNLMPYLKQRQKDLSYERINFKS